MANQKKKKKGAPGSAGKSAGKIANYYLSGRLLEKKLRHVIISSGYQEGMEWADKNGATHILQRLAHPPNGLAPAWLRRARERLVNPQPKVRKVVVVDDLELPISFPELEPSKEQ